MPHHKNWIFNRVSFKFTDTNPIPYLKITTVFSLPKPSMKLNFRFLEILARKKHIRHFLSPHLTKNQNRTAIIIFGSTFLTFIFISCFLSFLFFFFKNLKLNKNNYVCVLILLMSTFLPFPHSKILQTILGRNSNFHAYETMKKFQGIFLVTSPPQSEIIFLYLWRVSP